MTIYSLDVFFFLFGTKVPLVREEGFPSFLVLLGFPCGSAGKESACNVEDLGLIPGLGRSPGEGDLLLLATHSSILAWSIPGTGEPGGLPPMGSHRVGHD